MKPIAVTLAALAFAALSPVAAFAQAAPAAAAPAPAPVAATVAVVVAIKTPPGATDAYLRGEFDKAVPRYQAIPGLIRKYFTIQPGQPGKFGGIYYWTSKAAADAWFSDAWRTRATATYGSAPEVTYYDVPLAIDGKHP